MGKQKKQHSTRQSKAERRESKDAARAIARAEKRLANALRVMEDARAEMTRRETKLASLLRKHGRLPVEPAPTANGAAAEPVTVTPLSATQVVSEMMGSTPDSAQTRSGGAENPAPSNTVTSEHE